MPNLTAAGAAAPSDTGEKTVFKILLTISFCHLLNDTIQSFDAADLSALAEKLFILITGKWAASRSLRN